MADLRLLVTHLVDPARLAHADAPTWEALIRMARAESLIGQLSERSRDAGVRDALPPRVRAILDDADIGTAAAQRTSRWEAHLAARALRPLGIPVVLLKGAAYLAAGLPPSAGRGIGDLDILVPRDALPQVEAALLGAGWAWLKPDPYDDHYYRTWMHELPPLVSVDRGEMIDVHHTILPLTARPTPDAAALIASAVPLGDGLSVLSPPDMVLHSAAHLFADGEFMGALRNLWDIHRLLEHFDGPAFRAALAERARHHQLEKPLARACRFASEIFGTDVAGGTVSVDWLSPLMRARLLGRDRWGRDSAPLAGKALYLRGHLLRMPPGLLARHLFTKWRKGRDARARG